MSEKQTTGLHPKPQRLYVDVTDGTVGRFDSWAKEPYVGFYRLSTGAFVKVPCARMREATLSEARLFERAKSARVECAGWNAACEEFASIDEQHAKAYEADGEMADAALAYMRAKDARSKKR